MLFDAGAAEVHVRISSPPVDRPVLLRDRPRRPGRADRVAHTIGRGGRASSSARPRSRTSRSTASSGDAAPGVGALPRLPHAATTRRAVPVRAREAPLRACARLTPLLAEAERRRERRRHRRLRLARQGRVRRRRAATGTSSSSCASIAASGRFDTATPRDGRADPRRAPRPAGVEPLLARLARAAARQDRRGRRGTGGRGPRRPGDGRRAARRVRELVLPLGEERALGLELASLLDAQESIPWFLEFVFAVTAACARTTSGSSGSSRSIRFQSTSPGAARADRAHRRPRRPARALSRSRGARSRTRPRLRHRRLGAGRRLAPRRRERTRAMPVRSALPRLLYCSSTRLAFAIPREMM